MSDFYSAWLERSQANDKKVNDASRVARGKELKWVRTRQDYKAALMIAPELGFPTGGSCLMRAEIPVGWHTGKHFHGEEAIYVESGEGFMVLDDQRYDFFPGTVFHIPYRSPHQLFNTGKVAVGYLSGLAWHLEADIYMGKWSSWRTAGRTTPRSWGSFPRKGPSIGRRMGGGSQCTISSMRSRMNRSMGRLIFSWDAAASRTDSRRRGWRSARSLWI